MTNNNGNHDREKKSHTAQYDVYGVYGQGDFHFSGTVSRSFPMIVMGCAEFGDCDPR